MTQKHHCQARLRLIAHLLNWYVSRITRFNHIRCEKSIESHYSINMIKRYHDSLRRVYAIIVSKILDIDSNSILQMIFKALNDSTDFNDLISILLVFDAYSRMIEMNVSFSTITQRSITTHKTMKKIRESMTFCQINDVLNMWNDSTTILIHNLSLNSFVLVYRERNADQSRS